jgi:hypothetical protein
MLVAYLTHDEVNQVLARKLARKCGVKLDVYSIREAASACRCDAMICDLDFLPPGSRDLLVAELQRAQNGPVAVHGYNLPARQRRMLRRRGVIVARRLRPDVFAWLRAAVAARGANMVASLNV